MNLKADQSHYIPDLEVYNPFIIFNFCKNSLYNESWLRWPNGTARQLIPSNFMMIPDYGLIAEIILFSEGFESADGVTLQTFLRTTLQTERYAAVKSVPRAITKII